MVLTIGTVAGKFLKEGLYVCSGGKEGLYVCSGGKEGLYVCSGHSEKKGFTSVQDIPKKGFTSVQDILFRTLSK